MTRLFRIDQERLVEARRKPLDLEEKIEKWVAEDLSLVGVDGIVIGRQVTTDHGKRIDILAMDEDGNLIIIELKRDRGSREIVAQILDYASWVCRLTTSDVHELGLAQSGTKLADHYREKFEKSLPETLNATHQMIVVASEVDEDAKRIIEYLSEQHDVGINASFFNVHSDGETEWLTTDHFLDQEVVKDRAVRKARAPWSGFYYITGGTEEDRPWEPMREYGFVSARGGRWYTDKLDRLSVGDLVFYYQKNNGYLGYGRIASTKTPASDFTLDDGRQLTEVLPAPYLTEFADDPDMAAYVIGVEWLKTFDRDKAKTFTGIFANQNVVCKIYQQETVDFLAKEFGVELEGTS